MCEDEKPFCTFEFQANQVTSKRPLLFGRLWFASQTQRQPGKGTILDASLRRRLNSRAQGDRDRLQGRTRERRRGTTSFSGHWLERWWEQSAFVFNKSLLTSLIETSAPPIVGLCSE